MDLVEAKIVNVMVNPDLSVMKVKYETWYCSRCKTNISGVNKIHSKDDCTKAIFEYVTDS